jgi:hypothetical protein
VNNAQSLHKGEHRDFFRNTFEMSCGIATQHTACYVAAVPHPVQESMEATSSSGEGRQWQQKEAQVVP